MQAEVGQHAGARARARDDPRRGPDLQRDVLRFRSFVAQGMRKNRIAIIGDAAHTAPPTGAKGMNLAVADVALLHVGLRALMQENDARLIDGFE